MRERQTRLSRLRQKIWAPDNARSTTRIPPSLERTRFDKISHQRQHIWQHTPNAQLHLRDHGIEDLIAITALLGSARFFLALAGMDGMQLLAALAEREILLPVIFLTGYGDVPSSVRALKAGAFDYLCKPVSGSVLLASVRAALEAGERLSRNFERMHDASTLLGALTRREREVLRLAVDGMANKVIARRLGISHRTVEIHKARIMHKTGAANLLDLAHLAEACPRFLAD